MLPNSYDHIPQIYLWRANSFCLTPRSSFHNIVSNYLTQTHPTSSSTTFLCWANQNVGGRGQDDMQYYIICNTILYAILTSSSEEKWVIITFIFNGRKRNNLYKVICFKLQIYKGLGLHSLQKKTRLQHILKSIIAEGIFQNKRTVLQSMAEICTLRILSLSLYSKLT